MMKCVTRFVSLGAICAGLAGCASNVYVPPGGGEQSQAPEPPVVEQGSETPRPERLSSQPEPMEPQRAPAPGYREQGDTLSPAAASLIRKADSLMAQGRSEAALGQLERAQRISPRSVQVYLKLAEAYVRTDNLGAAEQFTLKGLSLSGSDTRLQKAGWQLLADIRRERGNMAGAEQARRRAAAL